MKKRRFLKGVWLCAAAVQLLWLPRLALAKYIGGDPPKCALCSRPSVSGPSDTSSSVSLTEGNLSESVGISSIRSSAGPTLDLSVIYNSYNADGSHATVDTVMGYGWTHSYNVFLFSQLGAMFRYGPDGRVTRYALGAGGSFTAATGYFETLVKNPDGSFTLSKKDKTVYTFKSIAGAPFLVGGPVWRLTSIVDRNGNTITLAYTGGNLTTVTDTYGRALTFAYNVQSHLTSVTDPDGRITKFQYDATGHMLTTVTDPLGNAIRYTYNSLYQITGKTDKAGRTFNYVYSNLLPVAVYDSSNTGPATLSNPVYWATNATQLALSQLRVYTPSTTTNTDGRGNAWKYQYDSNGYLLQTVAPDGATTSYSYDPSTLELATMTDPNGHTTSYTYDSMGNKLTMTDALGHITMYTYDPTFNMMTSMSDPRGRITTYTIDPTNGNRTREADPLGQTRKWTYDVHGNLLTDTDKNGHTTTYQYDAFGDRVKIADPLGYLTVMTYDAVGNLTSMTDPNGHSTGYQYDGMSRLIHETDATGHTGQIFYDGEGNRIQTIDRDGHPTLYQYDLRQRLMKTTDALGHFDTYTYDGNDNRTSWTDRDGHATAFQHDVQNRINKLTDALGDMTTSTYDGVGNILTQTDADGHTTTYTYDPLNRRSAMTDALSEETQYFYDTGTFTGPVNGISCIECGSTPGSSLVTEQIDPDGMAGVHAGAIYLKYDALNRLVIMVRKTGCLGAGCPDSITPGDAVTTYTYDPVGNRLTWTEPDGNTTSDLYDADNRRIQETNAAGDVTMTTYDGVGNVITATAPNLNVTTNAYDSLNRLGQVTDSVGVVDNYTYDPVGNRLTQTDGNGNTTSFSYDPLNRLITQTDSLGKTTTTQYDAVGNMLKDTDRNGNSAIYVYDAINRRIGMTDALGNATQLQYDAVGNLVKATDANLHATQYAYDAVNRLVKETDAGGLSRRYAYDEVGKLLMRTDQIGQVTTYTYSDLYFLLARAYPSTVNDSFTYDLSGRMLTAQRGSWSQAFSYDGANRLIHTVQNGQTIGYVYNIPGKTRQVTYPGGRAIIEHADFRARMDHINDAAYPASIVQYTYDLANNPLSRNYRNGAASAFTYNANNWTTNIAHNNPAVFAQFGYAYDNEGNKLYENKTPQDPPHSEGYQYDSTYRLMNYQVGTLSGSAISAPGTQTGYSLDPVGNWNSKTTNGVTQTRLHNVDNELIQVDSTSLAYDANGNLANDGKSTYAYDEENRLTSVTSPETVSVTLGSVPSLSCPPDSLSFAFIPGVTIPPTEVCSVTTFPSGLAFTVGVASFPIGWLTATPVSGVSPATLTVSVNPTGLSAGLYMGAITIAVAGTISQTIPVTLTVGGAAVAAQYEYDAFGRRVQRIANLAGTPSATLYFYDGARIIEEQNSLGVTSATYVYGNYVDEVLTMDVGGNTYYYHQNALWSVEAITDSTATPVERYAYDAYGSVTISNGTGAPVPKNAWGTPHSVIGNPWLFTGQQLDEETGLYYYRARYYDSDKGRFLQRDPTGIWKDLVNRGNGYSYVGNNPSNATDPMGTCRWWNVVCWACRGACSVACTVNQALCYATKAVDSAVCDTAYAGAVSLCTTELVARVLWAATVWPTVRLGCFLIGNSWAPYCLQFQYPVYAQGTTIVVNWQMMFWIDNWALVFVQNANDQFDNCINQAKLAHTSCLSKLPNLSQCLGTAAQTQTNCNSWCGN